MQISLTISGIRLKFADSTYSWGFSESLFLLNIYKIIIHVFHKLVPNSTHFVADSAKLLFLEQF